MQGLNFIFFMLKYASQLHLVGRFMGVGMFLCNFF